MMSVIEECKRRNIVFSIGHSTAGIETAEEAVQSGATLITHLFNAMQQLHHRDPGVVGLLGSEDTLPRPYYGIICDGVHIHKSCVKLAYRSHPHGAILVTDAMAQLLSDPGLRQRCVRRGLERSRTFNWDLSAERTLGLLRQIARQPLADAISSPALF